MSELKADLDYILKSHACTQVYYDEESEADYPKMVEAILAWHKSELERVIGEDEDVLVAINSSSPFSTGFSNAVAKKALRADQRKRAGL